MQYLFTTVYCKLPLCKVHKENCNLYFLQTFVRLGNITIRLSVITVWYSISCNINWQSRSPTPWFKNNLNLPVTRQFIDSYPNRRTYDHHECTICLAWGLYAQANIPYLMPLIRYRLNSRSGGRSEIKAISQNIIL